MHYFSQSCERNKEPILGVLSSWFSSYSHVLEIGSYSGQHGIYFCQQRANLKWQPTDTADHIEGLTENIANAKTPNCLLPITLDVTKKKQWPQKQYDMVFTANSLHIMSWRNVEALIRTLPNVCRQDGIFAVYGPFKYKGKFTSHSNAEFEGWLTSRSIYSGIRDFEAIDQLLELEGFKLVKDQTMPANNQLIVWQRKR